MNLEEIKALVAEARELIEKFNVVSNKLAEAGVTVEIETSHQAHGVVGIGRVDARQFHAGFELEL